jgi:exonuclease SbcC
LLTEQQDELRNKQATLAQDVCNLRGQPLDSNEAVNQVLSKMKEDVDDKLMELKGLLEKRGEAIQDLRSELDKIRVAGAFHRERERLNKLDEIPHLPEYSALDDIEKKAELRMSFLSELERCIEEEIEQAFSERFAALKHDVNEIYRELVGREDFPEIWIDPGANWEVLAGARGEGTGVTRVFNVGDMTAVALCLFLASASRASHDAGFILLDDPTQNLDDAHETRLAEILANLAKHRQIIVSSSRASFIEALRKAGTVKRQLIPLAPWDKNRSCRLEK